jgi:hypothetical protein
LRQLHVLGVSEDGATLLLGPTKNAAKPTYRIPLDDRLRAAARGQLVANGDRAEISLSPREIQARLRAGATAEEVAKAAGVPVARVMPYLVPVEAERTRIIDEARAATMHRHRGPDSSRPLGPLVDARLEEVAGIKTESIAWTARRRPDGSWIVGVVYAARGGRRNAEWQWNPLRRELSPLDPAAARLGSDFEASPAKRRATTKPAAKRPAATPAAKRAAAASTRKKKARTTTTRPAAKATSRTPATRAGTAAASSRAASARPKPTSATRAPARKAPARKPATPARSAQAAAAPRPAKAASSVRKPAAAVRKTAASAPARKPAARKSPAPAPARKRRASPPPAPVEVETTKPTAAGPPTPAVVRKPGQRVPLPSWSEVLLGVTGSRDEAARRTTRRRTR